MKPKDFARTAAIQELKGETIRLWEVVQSRSVALSPAKKAPPPPPRAMMSAITIRNGRFTSTPAVPFAQEAVVAEWFGEGVKSTDFVL
jgi:hypothetical protein